MAGSARVEVEQQREVEEMNQHPTEERVVDTILERTSLEPARPD